MSFNRLEAGDFVVSADSITAGLWTDNEILLLLLFLHHLPKQQVIQVTITLTYFQMPQLLL
jgi:TFIIF-interacting CTD phosphatase-like protein